MSPTQFSSLLEKYLTEEINSEELSIFLAAAKDTSNHDLLSGAIDEKLQTKAYGGLSDTSKIDEMFRLMLARTEKVNGENAIIVEMPQRRSFFTLSRIVAASVVLVLLLAGMYFLFPRKAPVQLAEQPTMQRFKNDIAPGHKGAVLTLADGQQIILDSAHNGVIASQGSAEVVKDHNQLAYTGNSTSQVVFNTMSTPKGRQYSLVLSDGSKVWLNAASSITFPTTFSGKERKVSVTGEAYFEVAHNDKVPFIVEQGNTRIQVLGTHFNVNAYRDESSINVTLLAGAVKVENAQGNRLIKPGQQVQVMQNGNMKLAEKINEEEIMAWKDERFVFESANIKTIMKQVARWYDVDVDYKADISYSFVADISMNLPVSELLKLLELTGGVHFKIDGNKITVMK